jgi:signal transduction histidine kinase
MTGGVVQESVVGRLVREARRAGSQAVRLSAQAAGMAATLVRTEARLVAAVVGSPAHAALPGLAPPPPGASEPAPRPVLADRDRIAAELQNKVIYRVFAAGLTLQQAAALAAQEDVRRQIQSAVDELDQVIGVIRDTVFDLGPRPRGPDVRQDILDLCGQLSPPPEVSFSGPVGTGLPTQAGTQLLGIVRHALGLISEHATPARVDITAGPAAVTAVIVAAAPLPPAGADFVSGAGAAMLRARASQAGVQVEIQPAAEGSRFTWHLPLAVAR